MNNILLRKTVFTFLLLTVTICSDAQIGGKLGYNYNQFDDWKKLATYTENNNFQTSGIEVGINYWFKLPKARLEFLPEIVIGKQLGSKVNYQTDSKKLSYNFIDFRFNTQIYPLNFKKDCDCPTFSDQSTFTDHLYFSFSPGIRLSNKSINEIKTSNSLFNLGVGLGYDYKVAENIFLSPNLNYRMHFKDQWEDQLLTDLSIKKSQNWRNLDLSIRVIYKVYSKQRQRGLFR